MTTETARPILKSWRHAGSPITDLAAFLKTAPHGTVVLEEPIKGTTATRVVIGAWFVKAPCGEADVPRWLEERQTAKQALGIGHAPDGLYTEGQIVRLLGDADVSTASWNRSKGTMRIAGHQVVVVLTRTASRSPSGELLYLFSCAETPPQTCKRPN